MRKERKKEKKKERKRKINFFEQIFEHINCPLSGLILELRKPRSED